LGNTREKDQASRLVRGIKGEGKQKQKGGKVAVWGKTWGGGFSLSVPEDWKNHSTGKPTHQRNLGEKDRCTWGVDHEWTYSSCEKRGKK